MKNIAIVGAGASGLVLANLLSDTYNVTLIEKNNKLGKKLLASGNGKCNFTNIGSYKDKYNNEFANKLVSCFNNELTRKYFSSLGLAYRVDSEGRAYPLSESSSSVLQVLKKGLKKVRILLDSKVYKIQDNDNKIDVYYNDIKESFDYVVCASGSSASNLGSDYAYRYLLDYGVNLTELKPSLVAITVKENLKILDGVRVKCLVNLYKDNELVYQEKGEVLFKENALSGIVIYNISSVMNRSKGNYYVTLDLSEDLYNKQEFKDLSGVVHPKVLEYLNINGLNDIKKIKFNVKGTLNKENAQVISGGVAIKEVNEDLSLKKNPNIFVAGEVLDCDGICGGYNLQFAFSCAFKIDKVIRGRDNG